MAKLCDGHDQPMYEFGDYFFPSADGLGNINVNTVIENIITYVNINYLINYLILNYNLWGRLLTFVKIPDSLNIMPVIKLEPPTLFTP